MPYPVTVGSCLLPLRDGPVRFELRRSRRRTIGITVEMGGRVVVTAPLRASMERIREALERHRGWLRSQVARLQELAPPPPPRWCEGERHRFLGREYPLHLVPAPRRRVALRAGCLRVELPHPSDPEQVRKLVEAWYRHTAKAVFASRLEDLVRRATPLGLERPPALTVRKMTRRWGSCSPRGRILMNTHAVKLPRRLLDYVLLHELCHLRVPHHGPSFWNLLARCLPDWKARKAELDREVL